MLWDLKICFGISKYALGSQNVLDKVVDIVDTVDIIESVHAVVMVDVDVVDIVDIVDIVDTVDNVDIVDIVDICEAIWITSYKSLWIPRLSNLKNANQSQLWV